MACLARRGRGHAGCRACQVGMRGFLSRRRSWLRFRVRSFVVCLANTTSVRLEELSDSNDSSSQSWIDSANEYYELEPLQALVRTPDFSNRTAVGEYIGYRLLFDDPLYSEQIVLASTPYTYLLVCCSLSGALLSFYEPAPILLVDQS